jgi:hypothetical protein
MKRSQSRIKPYAQLKSHKPLKRSRFKVRKFSKVSADEGASERELRDENDQLVREIIKLRDHECVNSFASLCRNRDLNVGHYVPRGVLAARWDLENCNLQCNQDNAAHEYNTNGYRIALAVKYGGDTVRRLERIKRENPHVTYVDLLTVRDELREELKKLK